MKKSGIVKLLLVVIVAIIAVVIVNKALGCGDKKEDVSSHLVGVDWKIVSTQSYAQDGKECMGYRVYVDPVSGNDDVYRDIFSYVTDGDGYYLHTLWIYDSELGADGSDMADHILDQTEPDEIPTPVHY